MIWTNIHWLGLKWKQNYDDRFMENEWWSKHESGAVSMPLKIEQGQRKSKLFNLIRVNYLIFYWLHFIYSMFNISSLFFFLIIINYCRDYHLRCIYSFIMSILFVFLHRQMSRYIVYLLNLLRTWIVLGIILNSYIYFFSSDKINDRHTYFQVIVSLK